VAFSPIWRLEAGSQATSEAETHQLVAAAAHELLTAIERGAEQTGNWVDERLGYALTEAAMSNCLARLAATGRWGRDNLMPSDVLWKIAGKVLQVGSLQHRARTKPLGYAGDFQLLADIVENRCCDHPLGKLFDRYFLNQAAPQAVRNRTEQAGFALCDHLQKATHDAYRVVSVGVGTGMDVQTGLSLLPRKIRTRVEVTLLDLDETSLEFAKSRVMDVIEETQVHTLRENLFRIAHKERGQLFPDGTHFLICSGLFDYLEDDVATAMLMLFWESLAEGGLMLVGNFVPYHPTRAYMEWIGNWYLQYRTPAQLAAIADAAGIPGNRWTIEADRTGADLFLRCRK